MASNGDSDGVLGQCCSIPTGRCSFHLLLPLGWFQLLVLYPVGQTWQLEIPEVNGGLNGKKSNLYQTYIYICIIGGVEHFLFSTIYGIMIPTD